MSKPSNDLEISLEDLGLSLKDLQAIARLRGIKDYESMSMDELSNIIFPLKKKQKKAKKGTKPKTNFSKAITKRSEKNLMNQDINFLN